MGNLFNMLKASISWCGLVSEAMITLARNRALNLQVVSASVNVWTIRCTFTRVGTYLCRLLIILCNVSVFVKAVDFGAWDERKSPDEVKIALVIAFRRDLVQAGWREAKA